MRQSLRFIRDTNKKSIAVSDDSTQTIRRDCFEGYNRVKSDEDKNISTSKTMNQDALKK